MFSISRPSDFSPKFAACLFELPLVGLWLEESVQVINPPGILRAYSRCPCILPIMGIPSRCFPINDSGDLVILDNDIEATEISMSKKWLTPIGLFMCLDHLIDLVRERIISILMGTSQPAMEGVDILKWTKASGSGCWIYCADTRQSRVIKTPAVYTSDRRPMRRSDASDLFNHSFQLVQYP